MSYDDDDRHKSVIGSVLSAVIQIVLWYYFIKIVAKLVVSMFNILALVLVFLFDTLCKISKFLYISTREYISDWKRKNQEEKINGKKGGADSVGE